MAKESMIDKIKRVMYEREQIRNIGIIAHIDHGKTTTSDSLLAGAGMLSFEVAGKELKLDFLQVERERGITVQSADVNMVHEFEGKEYLINLIDTPGHIDFGGDVTRAIRAIDGAIVIVDAVEGVMPQTETVLRQALKEYVKPVLFINKVDRLISELKLSPEKMQEKLLETISGVNKLIKDLAPKEFADKWSVSVQDGTVAFGSAIDKWAISFPWMKKTNISFKDIIDAYNGNNVQVLEEKSPLHKILLDIVVKHLPNPIEAQKYRVPRIWTGEIESKTGKSLLSCDPNGPLVMNITKVVMDPHAGEIAVSRIYSGTLKRGEDVYLSFSGAKSKVQQIFLWKGNQRFPIEEVPSGNIVGVSGLRGIASGETVTSSPEIAPFEKIKHLFEPVVTKAFEPKNPKDLQKLIIALKNKEREDPTLRVSANEETGEILVSGLGELHLEIVEDYLKRDQKLEIKTSPPIVVYREGIKKISPEIEGKSPNKHNKFYIKVEPLPEKIWRAISSGDIPEGRIKKKSEEVVKKLVELGMERDEAKRVKDIFQDNMFVDATKGIVHIGEVMEMCLDAFEDTMKGGPLAKEPVIGVKVVLMDAVLHEDAIHRGPAQVIPAVRDAIKQAILNADPIIYEPVQTIRIDAPIEFMGGISKIIQNRRGQVIDMKEERNHIVVEARMPVGESFGFTTSLRSETEGRGFWSFISSKFEVVPSSLQESIMKKIRQRKGLPQSF